MERVAPIFLELLSLESLLTFVAQRKRLLPLDLQMCAILTRFGRLWSVILIGTRQRFLDVVPTVLAK